MSIHVCTAADVGFSGVCIECEDPLGSDWIDHKGVKLCSMACVESVEDRIETNRRETHLHRRDMMCDCPVCTAAGLPSASDRAEWSSYLREYGSL